MNKGDGRYSAENTGNGTVTVLQGTEGSYTCGKHSIRVVESVSCIPETNVTLCCQLCLNYKKNPIIIFRCTLKRTESWDSDICT